MRSDGFREPEGVVALLNVRTLRTSPIGKPHLCRQLEESRTSLQNLLYEEVLSKREGKRRTNSDTVHHHYYIVT